MHYQYDKRYNPIGRYGCYFISLGAWAEDIADKELPDSYVLQAYGKSVSEGWMDTNCFITDPEAILNLMLKMLGSEHRVEYIGWWNKDTGVEFWDDNTKDDIQFDILRVSTPFGYHFKTIGFNPDPSIEQGTEINGRRYFKVV